MKKFCEFAKNKPRCALIIILLLAIIGFLLSGFSIKKPEIIYLCWFIWSVSFVFGLILFKNRKLFSTWHGKLIVDLGPVLPVLFAFGITLMLADIKHVDISRCRANMLTLADAVSHYCKENNGDFPQVSKWCDSIMLECKDWPIITKEIFRCPDVEKGLSGYAINKNLEGKKWNEIAPDTVVLFEALPGWNQNGGQELIRFNKHSFPPGSKKVNVVYRGQDKPKFINIKKSKTKNLKWKP